MRTKRDHIGMRSQVVPIPSRRKFSMSIQSAYLYLDFDSFFATAEQHFNPSLRGKPVGVVPLDTLHTGCIAVSREAKARGVKFGATIKDARATVPDMIFLVARPDAYVRLHNRILASIEGCVPVSRVRSIDEVVCRLLPGETREARMLAMRIKSTLRKDFSEILTCSIGVASTELLAKVGAEMDKPDGFVLLGDAELPDRLANLKLTDLPGVSDGIEGRLNAAGIRDFRSLWRISAKHARAIWGSVEGERFWNGLHGGETERPPTIKRMMGHSRMLPLDWRSPAKVRDCARQLALSAGRRLRRTDFHATRLTASLRGGGLRTNRGSRKDDQKWSEEIQIMPTRDDHTFLEALDDALSNATRTVAFKPRSVSVMLHGLVTPDAIQTDLFAEPLMVESSANPVSVQHRWNRVSTVMDELRSVHGPSVISLGPKVDVPGGYLGSKIAFGRIPDLADFSEAPTEDSDTHFCSFSPPIQEQQGTVKQSA